MFLQKKPFYTSNSWLFRPYPKFGGQNIAAVTEGIYRNPQLKVPYVSAGDVIAPLPPTELGVGVETAGEQNRTKIRGKNAMCSFDICRAHRHLSIFCSKQKM